MSDRADIRAEHLAFDTFWAAYPRKVARLTASIAFQKALKKTTLSVMLEALAWQSQTKQWQQGIIPNASTWLHQERWADEGAPRPPHPPPPEPLVELAKSIARANAEQAEQGHAALEALTQQFRDTGLSDKDAAFEAARAWLRKART